MKKLLQIYAFNLWCFGCALYSQEVYELEPGENITFSYGGAQIGLGITEGEYPTVTLLSTPDPDENRVTIWKSSGAFDKIAEGGIGVLATASEQIPLNGIHRIRWGDGGGIFDLTVAYIKHVTLEEQILTISGGPTTISWGETAVFLLDGAEDGNFYVPLQIDSQQNYSFVDNGDGTAILTVTAQPGTIGDSYFNFEIEAGNGYRKSNQSSVTVRVIGDDPPEPSGNDFEYTNQGEYERRLEARDSDGNLEGSWNIAQGETFGIDVPDGETWTFTEIISSGDLFQEDGLWYANSTEQEVAIDIATIEGEDSGQVAVSTPSEPTPEDDYESDIIWDTIDPQTQEEDLSKKTYAEGTVEIVKALRDIEDDIESIDDKLSGESIDDEDSQATDSFDATKADGVEGYLPQIPAISTNYSYSTVFSTPEFSIGNLNYQGSWDLAPYTTQINIIRSVTLAFVTIGFFIAFARLVKSAFA